MLGRETVSALIPKAYYRMWTKGSARNRRQPRGKFEQAVDIRVRVEVVRGGAEDDGKPAGFRVQPRARRRGGADDDGLGRRRLHHVERRAVPDREADDRR